MQASSPWHMGRVAPSVVMSFCCLVGIPGNVAVIAVLRRRMNTQRESFTLTLILNLAVWDLLSLLLLPFWIFNLQRDWILGSVPCKLLFFLLYWCMNTSVLTVTLLSVQRYMQVLYPQRWARLGLAGHKGLLLTIWALGSCIASPSLSLRRVSGGNSARCEVDYRSPSVEAAVLLGQSILGFVVPFSILVSLYVCLQRRVGQASQWSSTGRMTKLITSIVVSFFIFWTPLHVFNMLTLIGLVVESQELRDVCEASWDLLIALTFLNACLNPFLYAFSHSRIQTPTARVTNLQQPEQTPQ
ncbi:leukotriene B4 receptor 1-like [Colossoma macropomum]|uniref:leukotriene B4 receptor 1-like n=1 Tax=Colossoma macropomum TaxID=42526 RepID=UPI0018652F4E|nr:leukotriene B4 receptor 1-like [Colossoma macropomum]